MAFSSYANQHLTKSNMNQPQTPTNEVARLRKYIERLEIYSPENEWSQPEWRKLIGSKEEHEDPEILFKLYQFRLAPEPEEPVVVNTEPSNLVVDQKTDNVSDNEWRELGPKEVIGAEAEYNPASLGEWIKVPYGWIGEKCDITKIRTRRPLQKPTLTRDSYDENWNLKKQEENTKTDLTAWMLLQEEINKEVGGELRYLRDEIQRIDRALNVGEEDSSHNFVEINKLRDEIQKLKQK